MTDANAPKAETLPPQGSAVFGIERFEGVLSRRIIAHLVDWCLILLALVAIGVLLTFTNIITLGLLSVPTGLVALALPFLYFILYTGGPSSATPGMKLMGIELRDLLGGRPELLQAGIRSLIYSASISVFTPLILAVALFNPRQRAIHDMLTSTVVIRR